MRRSDAKYARNTWTAAIVFTLAALVPSAVLAFTEPYRATTVAASFLLPGGLYLLWCMLSPNPARMVLWGIPLMVLCAFQLVISYLFGNSIIAVDMFTNLVTTNASEAGELLSGIYPAVILVCVIYIPVIAWAATTAVKNRRARLGGKQEKYLLSPAARKKGALTAAGLMAAGIIMAVCSHTANPNFALNKHVFPFNVVHNMGLSVERWWKGHRYPANVEGFAFNPVKTSRGDGREIYVLVIGEASRAHSWSLYGYGRETTPRMDTTASLVVMRDVFTQSNTTHKSVPIILSAASARNYEDIYHVRGISALFSEAGFRTAFITNQPPNRALTDRLTAEADTTVHVTPRKSSTTQLPDGEILPHLRSILESTMENTFIVIHTYGSHAQHFKRYPREFARFTPDESTKISTDNRATLLNAYDNSVFYTDYVLSEIIAVLNETDAASAMLYISDHGEDVMDDSRNRFLHASPTTTYYQLHVPAIMWFSEGYKTNFPAVAPAASSNATKAGSTAGVFHTLAGIASLESEGYTRDEESWVSVSYTPGARLYVTDDDIPLNIMRTGLTREDINIMEEKRLQFDISEYGTERF